MTMNSDGFHIPKRTPLILILLTIISLLIALLTNRLITNNERRRFESTKNNLTILKSNLENDKELSQSSQLESYCGQQNIGKTQKNPICYISLGFERQVADLKSAEDVKNRVESFVEKFSKVKDYPSQIKLSNEDFWIFSTVPLSKYPDSIKCQTTYTFRIKDKILNFSLVCSGSARALYFPVAA